ncbi:MAG: hypothetical protein F4W95_13490 [Chloroflexi bacterium]|nr:hypothetical protein [Chloroflexota bacterium]MYD49478.1 hypothetical protein [Chloroflexota bacterium]
MEGESEKQTKCTLPNLGIRRDFFQNYYSAHGRSFPWREASASPFGILVAEILLKQTYAGKVANVWPSLIARYPSAGEMAAADPDELLKSVSELGFGNQRTSALLALSSAIRHTEEPLSVDPGDLIKLPYVGVYTAHAVACFAYGQRFPIVDLSIVRTISRVVGIRPPKDIRRATEVWNIAWSLLPWRRFKEHNYGLLDFAAAVCKPRSPSCIECPIAAKCAHGRHVTINVSESQHRRVDRL